MHKVIVGMIFASAVLVAGCLPGENVSPGYKGDFVGPTSTSKKVISSKENRMVTIGAGRVEVGHNSHYQAWYIIDQNTQVCWFKVGETLEKIDCCNLARIGSTQEYLTWLDPSNCDNAKFKKLR